ncbi:glycosyltransferase [Urechidicola vernalis]|uniref:Glycosyltransferase n=1 Tax=Urechidicola vernalis TaxID=3075600 RepID=A0ABU2Y231_9FLAO|nr:glycosyltransferase [Urechidicola sp. P050]MDT0552263.1 glycosyltransferase [Urechidicola sp. P050]
MSKKKVKILYTIPNFDTAGSGKVVYDLVSKLDKNLFEPHIACFHTRGAFFKEVENLQVPIHIVRFTVAYRPFWSFPFRLLKIVRFFKKHNFDIVHSWHWSSDFSEPLAARLAGVFYIYTKKAMSWGNKLWKLRSKFSNGIIYINRDMESQFFLHMTEKSFYMPLGVDTEFYKPEERLKENINAIHIEKDDFVVVSIANLVPVKGVEILLQAVKELEDSSIKVIIIGENENDYGIELKSTFENEFTYFVGKQNDIRPYLTIADVFVIPTKNEGRKEGMPMAPLEAMSSERIVIGSDISGIKDILASFSEHLFKPSNTVELKEKILMIRQLPKKEKELLQMKMREVVLENFTIDKCVKRHEELYIQSVR